MVTIDGKSLTELLGEREVSEDERRAEAAAARSKPLPRMLRFHDLKRLGIVANWVTLRRWVLHEDFPPGILLGPNSRAWTADSVARWLASRPAAGATQTEGAD